MTHRFEIVLRKVDPILADKFRDQLPLILEFVDREDWCCDHHRHAAHLAIYANQERAKGLEAVFLTGLIPRHCFAERAKEVVERFDDIIKACSLRFSVQEELQKYERAEEQINVGGRNVEVQ